jgi:hypothetical protein
MKPRDLEAGALGLGNWAMRSREVQVTCSPEGAHRK